MGAEGTQDHPYVAHYDEPDVPDATDAAEARRDAEALAQADRESARQMDFARWRAFRYVAGLLLACLSIAGGAVAVMSAIAALTSGSGPVNLVTTIDASGARSETLSVRPAVPACRRHRGARGRARLGRHPALLAAAPPGAVGRRGVHGRRLDGRRRRSR